MRLLLYSTQRVLEQQMPWLCRYEPVDHFIQVSISKDGHTEMPNETFVQNGCSPVCFQQPDRGDGQYPHSTHKPSLTPPVPRDHILVDHI